MCMCSADVLPTDEEHTFNKAKGHNIIVILLPLRAESSRIRQLLGHDTALRTISEIQIIP